MTNNKYWIVDLNGKNIFLIFSDRFAEDRYGREYYLKDSETIYSGCYDPWEGGFFVSAEFTPHDKPFIVDAGDNR